MIYTIETYDEKDKLVTWASFASRNKADDYYDGISKAVKGVKHVRQYPVSRGSKGIQQEKRSGISSAKSRW